MSTFLPEFFTLIQVIEGEEVSEDVDGTTVSGKFAIGGQLHFHLETHSTICKPNEEGGLDVTCSTQYIDSVQRTIATTLGIKESTINMSVRRLGGAFGGKVQIIPISGKDPFPTYKIYIECEMNHKLIGV